MSQELHESQATGWEQCLRSRVQEPLQPERLGSLLVIVPAASGDVALATTLIRYVKRLNPGCRVAFATEKSNVSLAQSCPGVDEVVLMPGTPRDGLSRRRCLREYAGRADAVVYTNWWPEDRDLFTEYGLNMMETIWLLAGVPGGVPPGGQRVWLETPIPVSESPAVLRRFFGREAWRRTLTSGVRRLQGDVAALFRRTVPLRGAVITLLRDIYAQRKAPEVLRPAHRRRLTRARLGRDFVILCTESRSIPPPSGGVVRALVRMLRADGRTVLHNVMDPLHAAPGTVPMTCTYAEFLCLRAAGVPFVGWRSGLCDVAAASPAPMCVLCPPTSDWCQDVLAAFGFNAMNVDADCLEIVCRDADDIKRSDLLKHLQGHPA